jgi:hypothetical protein
MFTVRSMRVFSSCYISEMLRAAHYSPVTNQFEMLPAETMKSIIFCLEPASCLTYFSCMMTETLYFSETFVNFCRTIWRYISEVSTFQFNLVSTTKPLPVSVCCQED